MILNMMVLTIFVLIVPLGFWLISLLQTEDTNLNKILEYDLNRFSKWSVFALRLIVGMGWLTRNENVVVEFQLVLQIKVVVGWIFGDD